MPTVICNQCGKPWMDTKYRQCPTCGASAGRMDARSGPALPNRTLSVTPLTGAKVDPTEAWVAIDANVSKILEQLERRTTVRVDIGKDATRASEALQLLAFIVVGLGVIGGVIQVIAVASLGLLAILTVVAATAIVTTMSWGLLTVASVVAGYVANRS